MYNNNNVYSSRKIYQHLWYSPFLIHVNLSINYNWQLFIFITSTYITYFVLWIIIRIQCIVTLSTDQVPLFNLIQYFPNITYLYAASHYLIFFLKFCVNALVELKINLKSISFFKKFVLFRSFLVVL